MKELFMEQRRDNVDHYLDDEYWYKEYLDNLPLPKHILDGLESFKNQSVEELIKQYKEIEEQNKGYE